MDRYASQVGLPTNGPLACSPTNPAHRRGTHRHGQSPEPPAGRGRAGPRAPGGRRAAPALTEFAHADYFTGLPLIGPGLDAEGLTTLLTGLPPRTTEVMCHPGYGDAALAALDPGAATREREVALLTNPALLAALRAAGVVLIRSADLAAPRPAPR